MPIAATVPAQPCGWVTTHDVPEGTLVVAQVEGLPAYEPATSDRPSIGPHGFHIHENGTCAVGDAGDPFLAAGGHWDPHDQPHGNHAGDLPVLFSNLGERGFALMAVFTDRFAAAEAAGQAVIIHQFPDDFRYQPSGDAGPRLGCGVIEAMAD